MQLTEQETNVIKDLQTQEKACVDKYRFYEQSAHDEELKNLFHRIGDEEQEHFDSLGMVLKGDVPNVSAARSGMEGYTPSESYAAGNNSEEKKHDQFLCTDCIATEKLVSSTYNDDVFRFSAKAISEDFKSHPDRRTKSRRDDLQIQNRKQYGIVCHSFSSLRIQ